jgi:hypothetical protein
MRLCKPSSISIGIALLLAAGKGYAVVAEQAPTLSSNQIQSLAMMILQNTPEHIHFKETKFRWVLTTWKGDAGPKELDQAVLRLLKEKYVVYRSQQEVPNDYVIKSPDGKLMGFKSGFSFWYAVTFEKDRIVKVSYSDWEGNLASSHHWKQYRWTGRGWEVVKKSEMLLGKRANQPDAVDPAMALVSRAGRQWRGGTDLGRSDGRR